MENLNVKKFERLESDESHYFQDWGSKRPIVPILEEVDNQIGVLPTKCTMNIVSTTPLTSDIITSNDGITPDYVHISEMYHIGKSKSSRHGISICGEGQCRGLVSGRWDSEGIGKLTFTSKHNGEESTIILVADGQHGKFYGDVLGPYSCDNHNEVTKRYEGMLKMDNNDIKMAKAKIGVRIEPYCRNNPNFNYIFNNEKVNPIDMKYSDINSSDIKRWSQNYEVVYMGKRMKCIATVIDVHNFVKSGMTFKKNMVNDYDRIFNMNDECAGGFLSLGGVWAIMGGRSSWALLGEKAGWHNTKTGIRFFLEFDESDKETVNIIKSKLFSERPEKAAKPQSLLTMKDNKNKPVWGNMVNDIVKKVNEFRQCGRKEREEEKKSVYSEKEINSLLNSLTGETIENFIVILDANEARKCKSLRNDLQKRFGICKKEANTNTKNNAEMKLF